MHFDEEMGFQFLGPRSTVLSPSDPRPPTVSMRRRKRKQGEECPDWVATMLRVLVYDTFIGGVMLRQGRASNLWLYVQYLVTLSFGLLYLKRVALFCLTPIL